MDVPPYMRARPRPGTRYTVSTPICRAEPCRAFLAQMGFGGIPLVVLTSSGTQVGLAWLERGASIASSLPLEIMPAPGNLDTKNASCRTRNEPERSPPPPPPARGRKPVCRSPIPRRPCHASLARRADFRVLVHPSKDTRHRKDASSPAHPWAHTQHTRSAWVETWLTCLPPPFPLTHDKQPSRGVPWSRRARAPDGQKQSPSWSP